MLLDETTSPDDVRAYVRTKYAEIAARTEARGCGCGCSTTDTVSLIGDAYDNVEGYAADADLKLGCGVPTHLADIRPGDTVLDLGSGAGLDAFIARSIVGEDGAVIGVDMTPEMVERARENARKLGYANVRFLLGEIEALPVRDASADVVISNCVLNLVPNKADAFAEMHRAIKPGGHFCVSDIVVQGTLPASIRQSAEAYAGCVAGAQEKEIYLDLLRAQGFSDITVAEERPIDVPDDMLAGAPAADVASFRAGGGILSITVTGKRTRTD
ncbi:MAG: arsenite methyltransferase [Rhodothermales bacterium]